MFIFVAACAGRELDAIHSVPFDPATAGSVLSFGAVILGYGMTWAPLASDFVGKMSSCNELLTQNHQSAYLPTETKSSKVFLCNYIGLNLPLILLQCLGACVQVGAMAIPEWTDGYNENGLGGLLDAIMLPLKGFRKFVLVGSLTSEETGIANRIPKVVLALGISTNNAPTIYSCSLTLQTFLPYLLYGEIYPLERYCV